ncbi:shufflon system plasmid conjugative transfer pilus tip adhesin PilV [Scandinavium goeteborgense]|uniref:shufflon system plasmid conjugative transfer pilus tip adhesin PilV n=1 Tax=Scandinavium goeteborgense TaxID=1851514 RepID=UPI0038251866
MRKRPIHTGGLSLIEAGIVLMIILTVVVAATVYWRNSIDNMEYNSTATQLNTVTAAATDYIHDNMTDLAKNVSAGHPVYVTGQQLRDAGYLMPGYSLTNNAHQDYQVAVVVNPKFSTRLVAFVLTQNGTTIPYDGMRTITGYAGGMAGYIHDDNIAEGAYGGWKMTLSDYGLSAKSGHLASYLSSDKLGTGTAAEDRLYRYSVDGHPGLNQMQTAIDMDKNNVENAGTVITENVTASDNVTSGTVNTTTMTASGTVSTHDLTASNTVNTNILTATGNVTANGSMTGGTVRANGRLSTGEVLQLDKVNTAGAACSPNGLVSRDSNGGILSCIDSIWSAPGGGLRLPPPQTISCDITHTSNGNKDLFQAKVDASGAFWTRYSLADGREVDWTMGSIVGGYSPRGVLMPADANRIVTVTLAGLIASEDTSDCTTQSGNHQTCTVTHPNCIANWTY